MFNQSTPADLQALWEELNQSDDQRHEQDLLERFKLRAQQYAKPQKEAISNS